MSDINFSTILDALNEKADRNLLNIDVTHTDVVIDWQIPTAGNNYTWYRKYKSGWVEQGGFIARNTPEANTVIFSVEMANNNYNILVTGDWTTRTTYNPVANRETATTTSVSIIKDGTGMGCWWQISGMAA